MKKRASRCIAGEKGGAERSLLVWFVVVASCSLFLSREFVPVTVPPTYRNPSGVAIAEPEAKLLRSEAPNLIRPSTVREFLPDTVTLQELQ